MKTSPPDKAAIETRLRASVLQNSGDPQGWLSLGDFLSRNRRFAEAEAAYRSCISASPSTASAYVQLAKLCLIANRAPEALDLLKRADRLFQTGLPPNALHVEVLELTANVLLQAGDVMKALPYLQEAVRHGVGETTLAAFARSLARVRFTGPRPDLKPIVANMLRDAVVPPADLVRAATSLLLADPTSRNVLESACHLDDPAAQRFAEDILLHALLTSAVVTDPALEKILSALRRSLLLALTTEKQPVAVDGRWLPFCAALACQCFINDYAYAWDDAELRAIDLLFDRIGAQLAAQKKCCDIEIALLACYRALDSLPLSPTIWNARWPEPLNETIRLQVHVPRRETELRNSIPVLTETTGQTTIAVRRQYEESPYPRWLRIPRRSGSDQLRSLLRIALPADVVENEQVTEPVNILIAGCGTGQESTGFALQFPRAEILAIDLSLPSLAYAARKAEEYGTTNIRHAQADLLKLDAVGPFDFTVCAGVLHHLEKPFQGLERLANLTRPGGHLMIALYSKFGRQDLGPVADFAKSAARDTSPDSLRKFRADVLALGSDNSVYRNAVARDDFFSLNMLRDMIFHVCEHRTTIPEIAGALARLELEFRGFLVRPEVRQMFHSRFGAEADLLSLAQWDRLENENPSIFSSMYHFMLRKRG